MPLKKKPKKKKKKKRHFKKRMEAEGAEEDTPEAELGVGRPPKFDPSNAEQCMRFEKWEMARLAEVVRGDPDWIHFSIGRAPYTAFHKDKEIHEAFTQAYSWNADCKAISSWMNRAESSIIFHILKKIIAKPGRADLFRSLGRGWVCVHLDRPGMRFKWWFESIQLVLFRRKNEIDALDLKGPHLKKYTQGYVVMSEIVFLLKGLTRLKPSDRNVPIISIQKMANDFKFLHKWATNEDVRNAVMTPFPTDEDRRQYSARTVKREAAKTRKKSSASSPSSAEAHARTEPVADETLDGEGNADGGASKAPIQRDAEADNDFLRMLEKVKAEIGAHNKAKTT